MNGSPPPPWSGRWTDEQVEIFVGNLLRFGVILAAVVAVVGGVPYLITYGGAAAEYHVFRGAPLELRSIRGILTGALAFDSRAIIQLGLLLLIATPIARVAFSLFAFVKQRDRMYVVITTIVLGILLWGLSGGHAA